MVLVRLQIISYTKGLTSVSSSQFESRVGFTSTMPSNNVSLYINNTKESDSGLYICQIIIPGKLHPPAELRLNVKGNTLAAATRKRPGVTWHNLSVLSSSCSSSLFPVGEASAEGERDPGLHVQLRHAGTPVQVEEDQSHVRGLLLAHAK